MYFLSGALAAFCSAERNYLYNFGRGYQEEQFCKIYLNWVSGSGVDVFLKISYLELWRPSCSVEQNFLCNFVKKASSGTFM